MSNNKLGPEHIDHIFGFHKATVEGENATLPRHRDVRLAFREFGNKLDELLPAGVEGRDTAFRNLQHASMWSHWAIAQEAPLVQEDPDA